MSTDVIVAVDVGTTGMKVALVTPDGQIVARRTSPYATGSTGIDGRVEQNPDEWWDATVTAVRSVTEERFVPVALAVTGQMQDVVLVEGDRVVRPAILYSDTRAAAEAELVRRRLGDAWERVTANEQDAASIPAKLLWLRRLEPEAVEQADRLLLGAHSYIVWRACGAAVCDPTTASTTGLFDFDSGTWFTDSLEAAETSPGLLPDLHEPFQIAGTLDEEAAQALGLPAGIPVVHGPGDAAATSLGAGAGEVGDSFVYLGTSGWVATVTPGERARPGQGIFTLRHAQPGQTLQIGAMVSVGANLEWARRELLDDASWDQVDKLAGASATPTGLLYLPYLTGERSPFRDPQARAGFIGVDASTTRADLVRAVMEGVAYGLRSIENAMASETTGSLVAGGGGCRSDVWCEILAAVLARPLHRMVDLEDVGAMGAAVAATHALGWEPSTWSLGDAGPGDRFDPEPEAVASYRPFSELHARAQTQISPLTQGLHDARQQLSRQANEPTKRGET